MKSHVRVAVIGGGVTGCSVLYHLVRAGWSEVALFERSELTSGSTWHAAAGTGAFAANANMGFLHKYSFELYPQLEAESGQSCGFHHVGGLTLARTERRLEELEIHRSKTIRLGLEAEFISHAEAIQRAPVLDPSGVLGILYEPARGHVDPSGVTQAFAKAARAGGAEIYRQCPVHETNPRSDGGWDIVTPQGTCHADHLVNASGLWAREVARLADVYLPLMPVEHHYFVTESIPEIEAAEHEMPLIGDADAEFYMRQEGQGLLLGAYETPCTHWAVDGTPLDFGHELLPDDLDRIERNLAQAVESIPVLGRTGIKRVINGPMIFSPDLNPLIGPYPGLRNYWCACGVMTAFSQAGAIGRLLSDWIIEGDPGDDVFMWDVTRFDDWASTAYTKAKTADMYSTRFQLIYPYEERPAGRPVRTTPIYPVLATERAVFGSSYGWEIPLWFAPDSMEPADELTFSRPNWFEPVGAECRAVRETVGLLETSSYAKYVVSGRNARAWLESVLTNRMPTQDGRMVLSPMLNQQGRLMGDFTVTRLDSDHYLLVGSGLVERFHLRWWEQFLPSDGVTVQSMSSRLMGFSITGPNARELLSRLVHEDVSNEAFPFLTARCTEVGPVRNVTVLRISFTGELGYELYFPPEHQVPLLAALREAGADLGLRLVGMRALGSLRIEKGFPSWARELSPDYTPYDAGLGRFVKLDKASFVGRDAALRLKQQLPRYHLATLEIEANGADAWGGEPVLRDGEFVGYVTSAAYGHNVQKSLALAYIEHEAFETGAAFSVPILGQSQAARALTEAPVDPRGSRMRS